VRVALDVPSGVWTVLQHDSLPSLVRAAEGRVQRSVSAAPRQPRLGKTLPATVGERSPELPYARVGDDGLDQAYRNPVEGRGGHAAWPSRCDRTERT